MDSDVKDQILQQLTQRLAQKGVSEALRAKMTLGSSLSESIVTGLQDLVTFAREHGLTSDEIRQTFQSASLPE